MRSLANRGPLMIRALAARFWTSDEVDRAMTELEHALNRWRRKWGKR